MNRPEFESWRNEFQKETSRGAAIVGHTFLEGLIEKILVKRLVDGKTAKKIEGLPFSSKTDLCYSVGAISNVEKKDLLTINRIRNKFAHSLKYKTFNNASISSECNQFEIIKALQNNIEGIDIDNLLPRQKFEVVTSLLILSLENKIKTCDRINENTKPWKI